MTKAVEGIWERAITGVTAVASGPITGHYLEHLR